MKSVITTVILIFAASFYHVADAADHAVVPIDWNRVSVPYPNDVNAELQKAVAQNAAKYALTAWYENKFGAQPAGGHYLDVLLGPESVEYKVRGAGSQALTIATLLTLGLYDARHTGVSEQAALDLCTKITRSVAYCHRVNFGGWGGGWQDDWWAAIAGHAGWLTWDHYDEKDRELIRKMVEWEANRRMTYTVPYLRKPDGTVVTPGDTKAEENAWNTAVLFLACAMMPNHDHYDKWYVKGIELAISAYSHPNDVESDIVINGKPLKEWLGGSNTEENYMVVNHDRVHPEYTSRTGLNLCNAAVLTLGGKPVPEGVFFNSDKVYRAVVETVFASPPYAAPGGTCYKPDTAEIYFPQGSDWGTCRYFVMGPWDAMIHAYGLDAGLSRDAAYWEKLHITKAKELQDRHEDGHMFANPAESQPGTEAIVGFEATMAMWAKWAVLQKDFKVTNEPPLSL
ncbi:MAG: hypothetical protein FWD31_02080 [Planctomycetaceae bacterium]|nr:hypothetical protein [Planctomycetaceae bacterium]